MVSYTYLNLFIIINYKGEIGMQNKICVYAICKNESQFVERWLNSMQEADYIVVLDTGSDDDTYEKLVNDKRVYCCEQKVINPWRFDVARNESMKLIPEDANILVCTDLDETLDPGWADVLREKWVEGQHRRAHYKYAWSHLENGEPGRIFVYNKIHGKGWKWKYPVHEMLVKEEDNKDFTTEDQVLNLYEEVYLHHYPDQMKSRGSYLPLLELRAQEDKEDWYGLIFLSHEYHYRGFYEKSNEVLTYILTEYADKYNSIEHASCYFFMGDNYRALGKPYDAIGSYLKAINVDSTYREPYLMVAEILNELGFYENAIACVQGAFKLTYRHFNWLELDDCWREKPYDILAIAYYNMKNVKNCYINGLIAHRLNPFDERIKNNLVFYKELFDESVNDNDAIKLLLDQIIDE